MGSPAHPNHRPDAVHEYIVVHFDRVALVGSFAEVERPSCLFSILARACGHFFFFFAF